LAISLFACGDRSDRCFDYQGGNNMQRKVALVIACIGVMGGAFLFVIGMHYVVNDIESFALFAAFVVWYFAAQTFHNFLPNKEAPVNEKEKSQ
jgi:cytochrome c biogenesis protein ResB